ncbi:MAG: SagB family peptide dehydrogenase [Acidobacteria bacterium]|nr:SagB family peptide dehydrogenase [Acidobacteriota bacterium]
MRRHACIVAYWQEGELIFENYATRTRIVARPPAPDILHLFGRWRRPEAVIARLPDYTASSLRALIAGLERYSFLVRADAPVHSQSQLETWGAWNPAAGFFHMSTKDGRYPRDPGVTDRRLRRKAAHSPPPAVVKRYEGARQVPLPPADTLGEFPQVLLARRTWRDFSRRPITIAELSTLLALTWRIQGWIDIPGQGQMPLKTSPSGGARHPLEAYVWVRRVSGLRQGLYHYASDSHVLEQLTTGEGGRRVVSYLPGQWWYESAPVLVLITAVFPRVQWKYDFPRAYRVVLAEAGHFCQTFCLTATWLGLAPFCSMALADSRIEHDLRIDGVTESVLYAAGVGKRPRDRARRPTFRTHR